MKTSICDYEAIMLGVILYIIWLLILGLIVYRVHCQSIRPSKQMKKLIKKEEERYNQYIKLFDIDHVKKEK